MVYTQLTFGSDVPQLMAFL